MNDAEQGITKIDGTRVSIVDRQRKSPLADPRTVALLQTVAGVSVAARRPRRNREMDNPQRFVAAIRRARISVVHDRRKTWLAGTGGVAGLRPVAGVSIAARGAGGKRGMDHPEFGDAGICGTRVSVLQDRGLPWNTRTRSVAGLGSVAGVFIAARSPWCGGEVRTNPLGTGVLRTRIVVVARLLAGRMDGKTILKIHDSMRLNLDVFGRKRTMGNGMLSYKNGTVGSHREPTKRGMWSQLQSQRSP
jgi:hypothetical protein